MELTVFDSEVHSLKIGDVDDDKYFIEVIKELIQFDSLGNVFVLLYTDELYMLDIELSTKPGDTTYSAEEFQDLNLVVFHAGELESIDEYQYMPYDDLLEICKKQLVNTDKTLQFKNKKIYEPIINLVPILKIKNKDKLEYIKDHDILRKLKLYLKDLEEESDEDTESELF